MRYPDGGGLSPAARERRETVRMQAARLFAEDVAPVQVAARNPFGEGERHGSDQAGSRL